MSTLILVAARLALALIGLYMVIRWARNQLTGNGTPWHQLSPWRRYMWLSAGIGAGCLVCGVTIVFTGVPWDIQQLLVPILMGTGYSLAAVAFVLALVGGAKDGSRELDK